MEDESVILQPTNTGVRSYGERWLSGSHVDLAAASISDVRKTLQV